MKEYIIQKDFIHNQDILYLNIDTVCMILNYYHIVKHIPVNHEKMLTSEEVYKKYTDVSKKYNYQYGKEYIVFEVCSTTAKPSLMVAGTSLLMYCISTGEPEEIVAFFRRASRNINENKLTEELRVMQNEICYQLYNINLEKKDNARRISNENEKKSSVKTSSKETWHEGMIDFVSDNSIPSDTENNEEMHFVKDTYLPKESCKNRRKAEEKSNKINSDTASLSKEKSIQVKKVISPFKCIFIKDFHKILESNGYFISQSDLYELFRKVFLYKSAGMWFPKNFLVKDGNMLERYSKYHKGQEDELTYMSCTPVISPDGVGFFLDYFHNMREDYHLYQKYFIDKEKILELKNLNSITIK